MIGHFKGCGVAISPQYQASAVAAFGPVHTPYKDPPFDLLPHGPRTVPQDALFHPSVQVYLDGFAGYQPEGLAALLRGRRLDPVLLQA
jgi:glutathione S-transferase